VKERFGREEKREKVDGMQFTVPTLPIIFLI